MAENFRWFSERADPLGLLGGRDLFGFDGSPAHHADPLGLAGNPHGGKVAYPSADPLASQLGVSQNEFHREVKPQMKKDFATEMKRIGTANPDIGVDELGNVVLRNPKTRAEVHTDVPLSAYGAG